MPAGDSQVIPPTLVVPPGGDAFCFTSRDREDELSDIVRRVRALHRLHPAVPLDRTAVVVRRPLPYVYLARADLRVGRRARPVARGAAACR